MARSVGWAELGGGTLSVDGVFKSSKPTYSYGTAAVAVAVDPRTGHVDILDYLVVDDVGRIVNPETLHGQVIGGTVQGLGSVFGEHLAYDADGQLLVASLADYLVPLGHRLSQPACRVAGGISLPEQSAGGQRRRRRRRHRGRRRGCQRGGGGAVVAGRRAARVAAVTRARCGG